MTDRPAADSNTSNVPAALVVPDPEAEKKAADAKRAHEEAERTKAEAKKKLNHALDQIEKLAG